MSLFDSLALATLPLIPTPLMRSLASRYIAGERLDQAMDRLQSLHGRGFSGIIDLLGEDIRDEAESREVAQTYMEAAGAVAQAGLDAYVSIKPTHVGLNFSEDLCFELYSEIAAHCAALGLFLRVEMEDHPTTDGTLRVFERLRERHENVGIVLQSRLFRTLDDIDGLAPGPLNVRMVKGIYLEPAEIAHEDAGPIRDAYLECTRKLLERDAYLSFATHDEIMAAQLLAEVEQRGLGTDRYEFQVLMGVREPLWEQWRKAGHPVRVYVPYGPQWRPYSQRRLKKNPQLFHHLIKDTVFFWRK